MKSNSTFYPERVLRTIRRNLEGDPRRERWAEAAKPWLAMGDDELWSSMFGHALPRSWMVWSNGSCPACGRSVPMYEWISDPFAAPWKMRCPHCAAMFPTNDFAAFHRSGLDASGVFDPALADRSLLFNADHPDPFDPLRLFGVDDGTGYPDPSAPEDPARRWRFIGAYLIYGQWKKLIVGGIAALANAHMATSDAACARKAMILLDRVADVFPDFDFEKEGLVYEVTPGPGYVSIWHDTNFEVRNLVLAYDMVFEAARADASLPAFLSAKAAAHGLANAKRDFDAIAANVEDRIFRESIAHPAKVRLNFPGTETLLATLRAVLGEDVRDEACAIAAQATAVDGVTGEKGLENYSAITTQVFCEFLALFSTVDDGFLPHVFERVPTLRETQRFFLDVRCLGLFYPRAGDCGFFARPNPHYVGVRLEEDVFATGNPFVNAVSRESMSTFLWRVWKIAGDDDLLRLIHEADGGSATPRWPDFKLADPLGPSRDIAAVIARSGAAFAQRSVDKKNWHLAILRSGTGADARAVWLKYDTSGAHGHRDGMNLGIFAKGVDVMVDFGYPPVQFSGWNGIHMQWYYSSSAHNTVVVDRRNDARKEPGKTVEWIPDGPVRRIRVEAPGIGGVERFERDLVMVDIDEKDFYLIDIFKVAGGRDHAKFAHASCATLATTGIAPVPIEGTFADNTLMRGWKSDPSPAPGWTADWTIRDPYGSATTKNPIGLRYIDFTENASAQVCEGWISTGGFDRMEEDWIPRAVVRRTQADGNEAPLASEFVGIFEPYEERPKILAARRFATGDGAVGLEIRLPGGRVDLFDETSFRIAGRKVWER